VLYRSPSWRILIGTRGALLLILASLFLVSCGARKDLQGAEEAVTEFHIQLDSEQYASIYSTTADDFRKATSEAEFTALLQAIHRKLGHVTAAHRQNWRMNIATGTGEVISLEYATDFDGGPANERFTWQIRNNQPVLLGYNINSNALIEK
jgi:hypothetical protein